MSEWAPQPEADAPAPEADDPPEPPTTGPHANDCVEALHSHVGICQRQGYRNGWADAVAAIAAETGEL